MKYLSRVTIITHILFHPISCLMVQQKHQENKVAGVEEPEEDLDGVPLDSDDVDGQPIDDNILF